MAAAEVGQRVVRSPTWTWRDQDGGQGHVGTVIRLGSNDLPGGMGVPLGWAKVRWDNGYTNNYQVGTKEVQDLMLLDNAPAGVVHTGIECDSCGENPISGIRWKCSDQTCPDLDLCTACYMGDKHDISHQFTRFNNRKQTGLPMPLRFGEAKTTAKGLYPGATVKPGKDWKGQGDTGQGKIVELTDLETSARSAALVSWAGSDTPTVHRVGCGGKVELECVEPATGMAFIQNHLPLLGLEAGLCVEDHVAVTLDADMVEAIQTASGQPWTTGMAKVFLKVGKVGEITLDGDVKVVYPGDEGSFVFHPEVLTKVVEFCKGDQVRVGTDLAYVRKLQTESRNGWVDGMKQCLGVEGRVVAVDTMLNCRVDIPGVKPPLSWHPCALTLIKRAHAGTGRSLIDSDDTESMMKALLSLLKLGADSSNDSDEDVTGGDEGKMLMRAAKTGNVEQVVQVLSKSPDKVDTKVDGKSALHRAAVQGHLEVVQALLTSRATIDITDDDGNTPMHYAVEGDEPAIMKYLAEQGADVNMGNKNGRRPLHNAAWKGHVDCTRVLIKLGCNANLQDTDQDTALHDAIYKKHQEVIELILEAPDIDLALTNKRELTPLQFTAFLNRPQAAELIVEAHPRAIMVAREDGHTVAHIAAVNNNVATLKIILAVKDSGLNIDAKNIAGLTALHLAAAKGQTDCIELLVAQGADVNIADSDNDTALHLLATAKAKDASQVKDSPTLKKLRERYPDSGVDDSASALLCFLVLHGASVDAENNKCRTPLSRVKDAKLRKTLRKLAKADKSDDMGEWEFVLNESDINDTQHPDQVSMAEDNNDAIDEGGQEGGRDQASSCVTNAIGSSETGQKSKIEVFDLVHEIDVSDLKLGKMIGKGQFGVVHRASWRGTPVAVKKIPIMGCNKKQIEKEVSIHRRATHPNIVQMMALGYQQFDAYIVMQLIEGTSLSDVIFPDRPDMEIKLDRSKKLRIAREVLQALTFMHACNILHLDIKPANILIEKVTFRPYLCDMGLAHIKNRNIMTQSSADMRGTPCFMPPEALGPPTSDRRHSDKHDIWSVAGTLIEMFSGKRLWGDPSFLNPMALLAQMVAGVARKPPTLAAIEPSYRRILEPCFNKDPASRPSAQQLLDEFTALT